MCLTGWRSAFASRLSIVISTILKTVTPHQREGGNYAVGIAARVEKPVEDAVDSKATSKECTQELSTDSLSRSTCRE